ncbi:MAG TPA: hypothetical protein DCE44_24610 [Verrucomicrobiales bacterium]|nr:hypothetical protein [Verrucomicrobiales bacterium]
MRASGSSPRAMSGRTSNRLKAVSGGIGQGYVLGRGGSGQLAFVNPLIDVKRHSGGSRHNCTMSEPQSSSAHPLVFHAPAHSPAARAIISRAELTTPNARLVSFAFGEEAELSEHTAARPALVHIVRGECEFRLGHETHHLQAGDVVWMPPGTPHALHARGPFMMWLILLANEGPGLPHA